ncbi:MAG: putative heme transporter [Solirubrobacteraceae bacterium]|jgi:uncharacterized membrane protein YbhN (UPF0104 family)|nr:putative heme transporter [Solirubrobacteraceae bacterium]
MVTIVAEPIGGEPIPGELSWPRLRRRLAILVVVLVAVTAVVSLLPGLGSVRERFAEARPGWILVAVVLQVLSCVSYVAAFRAVFCRRMSWRTSYEIGMAELATNSLISVGGAGGLALGAWILRRGGMPRAYIARRTVAFFLLTSAANVATLVVAGVGMGSGLLHGAPSPWFGVVPAVVGLLGVGLVVLVRPFARVLAARTAKPKLEAALESLAAGVDEALALLRGGDPKLILGVAGYMLFDVAVLGVCFTAFGNDVPPAGVLLLAYLIGQLGGLVPIPGGIGGVDGGLIGTLILYGAGTVSAATAVLGYRGIVLLVPVVLGVPAMLVLQRRLRQETHDIMACTPGDEVEILGRGRVSVAELLRG